MKTLFERLKPEILTALNDEAVKYPATIELLIQTLQNCHTPMELSMSDAYRLTLITESGKFGILELLNCFNEL
jgi:hypothetical protein